MPEYRFGSTSLIHSNYLRYCMNARISDFNKDGKAIAARLYMLAPLMGSLPASEVFDIACGMAEIEYHEDYAVIRLGEDRIGTTETD